MQLRDDVRSEPGSSPLTRGKRRFRWWSFLLLRLIPAHAGKTAAAAVESPYGGAHPRSRGENLKWGCLAVAVLGSSPLTRGKLYAELSAQVDDGLIPAHAGKTCRGRNCHRETQAHPRSRGENTGVSSASVAVGGSSPLTRGKLRSHAEADPAPGLIPAHAGKTFQAELEMIQERAHPRSRGENCDADDFETVAQGSSPLTRGKLPRPRGLLIRPGLIPAHAGKTSLAWAGPPPSAAHPRSRGENAGLLGSDAGTSGSSPLTRGKQARHDLHARQRGLIPAHAGKTGCRRASRPVAWAHPRSRGENLARSRAKRRLPGSSPLTRGKLSQPQQVRHRQGLIPAHAGKTLSLQAYYPLPGAHPRSRGENEAGDEKGSTFDGSSPLTRGKRLGRSRRSFPRRAHPRSRGENTAQLAANGVKDGSSPLTRGKRVCGDPLSVCHGLIPAHAGKTRRRPAPCGRNRAHPRSRGENRRRTKSLRS